MFQAGMTRPAVVLSVLALLTASLSFAQRNPLEPMRPPDEEARIELVVHVIYSGDESVGEHIDVLLESAAGGVVAEEFTNAEGKALFHIRPGSYVIRVRGAAIKEVVSSTLNIEFERIRHEYVRTVPLKPGDTTEAARAAAARPKQEIPENARGEFEKGNAALKRGETEKAIAHFNKAIALYPRFAMAYNNLAAAYMKSKDFDHARVALNNGLKADRDLSFTSANLVRLALLEHNFADAMQLIEKVLAKEPKSPEFLFLMCEAQFFSGNYDQALIFARKAYAAPHEQFELAHIIAARALEAQRRPEEARVEYARLLQESPDSPEAVEASKSIARLESVAKGE